jgi:hypothetical protein
MIIIISMDMQTFAFVHCIFSTHQHLGIFYTMLHNSSRTLIWYSINISTNINVNIHTPRNRLIFYNSMQDQIFIPEQVEQKTSLQYSNVIIPQMMKT